ncbi:MAG: type II toxin-antitoxin system ParD family antitoxin [bacterium]|nr:type II toxin-antitoxin system ParD family antitoxin [bacterium]
MNVTLSPAQVDLVREKIEAGHYRSADEVLDAALKLLKGHEDAENRLEELLTEADQSGEAFELTPEAREAIEHEAVARLATRKRA